jgi:citrate synthase
MIDALLVCFAEHAMSPSSAAARMVMSGAGYIIPALAGGILSIGYTHVDAHEAAQAWITAVKMAKDKGWTLEQAADFLACNIRSKDKDPEFVQLFGERNVIPGWHHPQHIRDLRSPRVVELGERLGVAGDHARFVVALENATAKYWGRTLYMNVAGIIAATLVDLGFRPEECLAFCAIARSVSIAAHSMEEKTREKGWRASTRAKITQPLDLALQKPEYYDGPADRHLPEQRIVEPLMRAPYHYTGDSDGKGA